MKLYNVPRGSLIKLLEGLAENNVPIMARKLQKGRVLHFCNTDGMFSRCYTMDNQLVHLGATAEVEIIT